MKTVDRSESQPCMTAFLRSGSDVNVDASSSSASGSVSRSTYSCGHPRQKMLADSIVKNIVVGCNLPVSLVDNPKFRKAFSDFDPVCASKLSSCGTGVFPQWLDYETKPGSDVG